MIPQQFIDEIQQRTDIVEVVSGYIPLKRAGRNFKAPCPFHNEKTPSFIVSPQKQIFHCFGCGEGGGVVQFVMRYEKVSFVEAIEMLAKRLGMAVPYQKTSAQDKIKTLLYEVAEKTAQFFYEQLQSLVSTHPARQWLVKRGLSPQTVETFKIGYAPGSNQLLSHLRKQGYTLDILEKASVISARAAGGYGDLFRERIMFPISDLRNRVIGFGGRTISDGKDLPKYVNSLENSLYSKREHLFGLNLSKDAVLQADGVIVTEGYLDMIIPFSVGIQNVAASLGTALTAEQIRLIKRYTKNVFFIFDPDAAGQAATLRAIDTSLENDLNVWVVCMPEGFDLDLAVRQKGAQFVLNLLKEKVDFFDYKLKVLSSLHDKESTAGKVAIANNMLTTIQRLSNEVERHEYIKRLASALHVDETSLAKELGKAGRQKNRPAFLAAKVPEAKVPLAERMLFRFMFTSDKACDVIQRKISSEDFSHPLARKVFSFIVSGKQAGMRFSTPAALNRIEDSEVSSFIADVLIEDIGELTKDVLKDCIGKMRRARFKALKEDIKRQICEAEKDNDSQRVRQLVVQFNKIKSEVNND